MKHIVSITAFCAGAVFLILISGFVYAESAIRRPYNTQKPSERIEILRGIGSGKIGALLEERGIIAHRYIFYYYLWRYGRSDRLQAGVYELSPAMSVAEIARKMMGGAVASDEVRVTIPEGYTSEEIGALLQKAGLAVDIGAQMQALGIHEGMLFPDTYFFKKEAAGRAVVARMHDNFIRRTAPLQPLISQSGRAFSDILIMASLIEEEIPHSNDRPIIAGLLWKRLGAGMPLQVDATVIYAKGVRGGHGRERMLTAADLGIDSRYNTYRNPGLPPYPIANPGLDAITAALAPQESEYWYYLSKPDGTTVFSRSLEEHNRAKSLYLR